MKRKKVISIFEVTEYKTNKRQRLTVTGDGQESISHLRTKYPRFTKFVLEGFEVEGNFIPLLLPTYYLYDRRN